MSPKTPSGISYVKTGGSGVHKYVVLHAGEAIGSVSRFQMSGGQFGSTWKATSKGGKTSTRFTTREAAAAWLASEAAS